VEIVYRQSGGIGDGVTRGEERAREKRNAEHQESDRRLKRDREKGH